MAGRYGRNYAKNEDFDEGEMWGVMEDNKEMIINPSSKLRKPIKDSSFSTTNSSSSPRNFTAVTTPRMIPRSSSSEVVSVGNNNKQSSAPVDIPDWSKIYGKTSKKKKNGTTSSSSSWVNYNNDVVNGHDNNNGHHGYYYNNGMGDQQHHQYLNGYKNGNYGHVGDDDGGNDDDDDDIDGMVPPHEYLAKKLARNQISSFSVYEGVGRTLKGRDLSKVRNTILSKTGFLE